MINICGGGETLLPPEIIGYTKALLEEGHYVMIVTNGIFSKRIDQLLNFDDKLLDKLFFKFSYHYLQLEEKGLLDKFFDNVLKVHHSNASFTLELMPSDELIPYIERVKSISKEKLGTISHVTVGRDERKDEKYGSLPILTKLDQSEYVKIWNQFDSELFRFKMDIFEIKRKEFCYAGDWSFVYNVGTGRMSQCYSSFLTQNITDDPTKNINFLAVGNNCTQHHCKNGHAFLGLGNIPNLSAPTYAAQRNNFLDERRDSLKPIMKQFMESKLYESNNEYSTIRKIKTNLEVNKLRVMSKLKRTLNIHNEK